MLKEKRSNFKENCKKMYYISPYMPNEEKYKKHISPAAQSKVEYIRSTLVNESLVTVSVNCSLTVDNIIIKNATILDDYGECRVLFSISSKKKIMLPVCGIIMLMSVFLFTLLRIRKWDTVILYHSIYYDFIIRILKKIKKFKLIYEVEEVYADVRNGGKGSLKEIRNCQIADAYIFPTELLNKKINVVKKPHIIIYGAYNTENINKSSSKGDKINVVYSGTLMKGKGAEEVIKSAEYLDERYVIRIIGYGSENEICALRKEISLIRSSCEVIFDGLKYGLEYYEYLSKCDIGLCIQPQENLFNETSFPSKILSYLSAGLKIVATNIAPIRESELSPYICFAISAEPKNVALAIRAAEKMAVPERSVLIELDKKTKKEIKKLLDFL